MGILDFIKGKKKEEEFEGSYSDSNLHNEDMQPAFHDEDLGSRTPDLQPNVFPQANTGGGDLQLLLTKIELINQRLEVIDRRLQTIEKIAKESQ